MSRERGNYRQQFLKKNKGLFGLGIYFCGYCYKPVTRSGMEVDHIIPFSKGGLNHVSNLTASCRKCNRKKSDSMDHRIAIGFVNKIVWGTIGFLLAIILAIVGLPFKALIFNKKMPVLVRVATSVIIAVAIYYVYNNYTS